MFQQKIINEKTIISFQKVKYNVTKGNKYLHLENTYPG